MEKKGNGVKKWWPVRETHLISRGGGDGATAQRMQ